MKILLLSDSKVGKEKFIESLMVEDYSEYHSMNNGIAIKMEELNRSWAAVVYDTVEGACMSWCTGDTNYDVYLRLEARGVR